MCCVRHQRAARSAPQAGRAGTTLQPHCATNSAGTAAAAACATARMCARAGRLITAEGGTVLLNPTA